MSWGRSVVAARASAGLIMRAMATTVIRGPHQRLAAFTCANQVPDGAAEAAVTHLRSKLSGRFLQPMYSPCLGWPRRFSTEGNDSKEEVDSRDSDTEGDASSADPGTEGEKQDGVGQPIATGVVAGVRLEGSDLILPTYGAGPQSHVNEMVQDFDEYLDSLPKFPSSEPVYDLHEFLGDDYMSDIELMNEMSEQFSINPQLLKMYDDPKDEPPYPGAKQILRWTQHGVLKSVYGNEGAHPINKKVECQVYLKELQDEMALTDDAIKLIIAICGPRYQKETGELRLVSEKYREREDNRRHIVEMLTMLCEEGKRLFPNPKEEEDLRRYRQACKEEAEKLGREIEASRKVAAQPDGAKAESASMTQGAVA